MKNRSNDETHLFEQEMQVLYDLSANGIIIFRLDEEGEFRCSLANQPIMTILMQNEQYFSGKSFQEVFVGSQFSQLKQAFFNLVEYQDAYPVFVNLNDTQYKVFSKVISVCDKIQSVILSFNARWRFSPGYYGNQVLLDTLLDGIFIFDVGDGEKFYLNFLNTAHMKATGLDITTDIGKTPYELVGPEVSGNVIARYKQCVETRQPMTYEEELKFSQDGETTWWQTKISPVIIDGKVKQIIGSSRDISAHKKALRRIETLYIESEALFSKTSVPIWVEDVEDDRDVNSIRLKRYNPFYEQLYGLKTEDFVGKTITQILPESEAIKVREKYAKLLQLREHMTFEIELVVNGMRVVNLTTLTPVIHEDKIVNIIGSSLDISELRRVQDLLKIEGEMLADRVDQQQIALQLSFEDQDDFLSTITEAFHEPLTSILGLTELVLMSTSQEDSRTLYLEQIKQQSEQLFQLVDRILRENQIMTEDVLRIHSFDLKKEMKKTLQACVEEEPSWAGRISFDDQIPMDTIWQDQQRLFRILQFLIYKAFDVMMDYEKLVIEGFYLPDQKKVRFAGRIDISSDRYPAAEKEAYLQQFDQSILDELRKGADVQLIQILVSKIGGDLSYEREGNTARVILSIPLVHPVE